MLLLGRIIKQIPLFYIYIFQNYMLIFIGNEKKINKSQNHKTKAFSPAVS